MSDPASSRRSIADPLPQSVLTQLVADLPGPKGETDSARAARFEDQLREVLSYNPRNAAEAMLAAQCVLLPLLGEHARSDAGRPAGDPALAKQSLRHARQFDKSLADMKRRLQHLQTRPLGPLDPAWFAQAGLGQRRIADPGTDQTDAEETFSNVIVPLYPAPKMLQ